jgi:glutamine cyclotransferase
MKKSFLPVMVLFCLFISFFSCSNKPKRSRKPVSAITIYPEAKNYIFGQAINIRVETKVRNGEIDKIELFYKDSLIKVTELTDFTIEGIKLNATGANNIRVKATKTDGVDNIRIITLNVISDITPKRYSYSILQDYPHNTNFFTQGLVFYDGYIYEGTGETGKSGIFKVDLMTGKILQEYMINEEYFGEGITILNNKLYQLTYRAQTGFIYDIESFEKKDSFKYRSKEGWGLTNDGQYLIMSNGTHELIWLDPENFSEIKKIEVVNNKGPVNFLNELEYINGHIYANVYTTDLIVIIDSENGKVLSEIDLKGIINMYKKPSDTIDVQNGIAYDDEKNRLFVTGKWWPRLFEIELIPLE